jgi:uncharacterized membrane-anchored protein YitT (DUF2179 family)
LTRSTVTLVFRTVLSCIVIAGLFTLIWVFMSKNIPLDQDRKEILLVLFGAVSAGFGQVLTFWFGSSQGSADKSASRGETT